MEPSLPPDRQLSSWKEISDYPGISVRTAQSWERDRGLPIQRMPGPIVTASVHELESWKRCGPAAIPETGRLPVPRRTRWPLLCSAALVFFAVVAGIAYWRRIGRPVPSHARFEEQFLVVLDSRGGELWRKEFPHPLASQSSSPTQRRVWVIDLDGDGTPEVLFASLLSESLNFNELYLPLICYSADGRERWRYLPGKTVRRSDDKEFSPPFGIRSIAVTTAHGRSFIAVSAFHYPHSPAQISLLDETGRVLGSYWHGGHPGETLFADLNRTGKSLLYLGGINNEEGAATLIALDPDQLSGELQASGGPFVGIPQFKETQKVLFPRSAMNEEFEEYNGVSSVELSGNGLIVDVNERFGPSSVSTALQYYPDAGFHLRQIGGNDRFSYHHRLLYQQGVVPLGESDELARLKENYPAPFRRLAGAH